MPRISQHLETALYPSLIKDVPRISEPGFFSQEGQDRFLVETVFNFKRSGVFVDVGAHDGTTLSNTWYLEKELGWTGLAIEPIPSVFKNLQENRGCTTLNLCAGNREGTVRFLELTGYTEMLSGILDRMDSQHLERIDREQKVRGGTKKIVDLPCRPLRSIVSEHGLARIDYLSVDTEGSELEVLESLDFSKTCVDVISAENNSATPDINRYLTARGFKLIAVAGVDEIYRFKSDAPYNR